MSKQVKLLITSAILLLVIAVIGLFITRWPPQVFIKTAIEQANYCEDKSDCQQVVSQCPFGCYVFVNKGEAERIEQMITGYQSRCIYSCVELTGYDCVNNTCVAKY